MTRCSWCCEPHPNHSEADCCDNPDSPTPIYLPPEPPRDRIIEAVDADGEVKAWHGDEHWWRGDDEDYAKASGVPGDCWYFSEIVRAAISHGWSLRHVPAENGESQNDA